MNSQTPNSPNDDEPAFPRDAVLGQSGMSLRDAFALAALAGIMTRSGTLDIPKDRVAETAFRVADAMLAERRKP
jgi:hypothetical protein